MHRIRSSILSHVSLRGFAEQQPFTRRSNVFLQQICGISRESAEQIMDRVLGLVKKFDKIDASKVTETADFQKDLCLDSLDRVELFMAFEQEFSIEMPDEKADKLTCCADVAKYIVSGAEQNIPDS